MQSLNGDFALIWKSSAKLAHASTRAASRIAIDEQFWQIRALGQPLCIALDDSHNISRFTVNRQFARPDQRWQPPIGIAVRRTVSLHLLFAELSHYAARQHHLDEEILLENKSFSFRRAQSSEPVVPATGVIFPAARQHDSLEVGNRLDLVWISPCAIEGGRPTPIMSDQSDIFRERQRVEPSIQVTHLIHKAISLGRRFAGPAHSDEVWRQASSIEAEIGNNVSPLIRPGWSSMQKDHRLAFTRIDIADLGIQCIYATAREVVRAIGLRFCDDGLSACTLDQAGEARCKGTKRNGCEGTTRDPLPARSCALALHIITNNVWTMFHLTSPTNSQPVRLRILCFHTETRTPFGSIACDPHRCAG